MHDDTGAASPYARAPRDLSSRSVFSSTLSQNGHLSRARLYTPAEVAQIFQVAESWLKDKARRREIPFTMMARQYRFTEQQIHEIVQHLEVRPAPTTSTIADLAAAPRRRAKRAQADERVALLSARAPRRRSA